MHGLPVAMRVLVLGGQREEQHRPPCRPAQFLHPEDASGHRSRRAGRSESHVRGPLGLPLQERPVLLERLRPDREAARRPDFDRRVMRTWVAAALLMLATAASAQDKTPPYWASIASGEAMMRTGPGRNYPGIWLYKRRDLPVRVVKLYPNWRLIEDPDGTKGWMLVTLLSDQRTAIVKPGEPRPIHIEASASSPVR